MATPEDHDLVVLGSGAGGKLLAWTFASRGQRVVVVERKYVGGSCPNIACLPSKNVIHAAKVASYGRRAAEFGAPVANGPIDMTVVRERKRKMVADLVEMHLEKYRGSGAELVMGSGRFTGPRTIEVALRVGGTRTLRGTNVVVNTGTRATIDATPGLRDAKPMTHIEALELDHVPEHLVVLGGGFVGLELAQAFRRFGSRVTVVERNPALVHREDPDVSEAMGRLFADEGIAVSTDTAIDSVSGRSGDSVRLRGSKGGKGVEFAASHLLVAAGRTPNTDGIGLEFARVELDARGYVKVDERLRTTAAGVWAVGDCAGSPQFTHIGENDFAIVRDNLAGGNRVTTGRQVPSCMFTDPELARIGLNEREAKARGIAYRLAKLPMANVFRAMTLSETRGFLKALIGADDRILGFTGFGTEAGELMAVVQTAMLAGLPYTALRDMVITHPTMAEGLLGLFAAVPAAA
jgi:pyruvate/2-oxoglutarate dehydrogenase complex dihydrolipoamide dehydrogenase (E3) component